MIAGRYLVESRLAAGATSEVFVGRDLTLGRQVAIKVLHGDTGDRQRFAGEVRLLAALDHPGLVRVYDAVDEDRLAVLIMELVDGPSLAQQLTEGPLIDAQVRHLGMELAGCLTYLHQRGVVHRDIKPANILLGGDGRARLADFGIARLVDATHLTQAGQTIGTLTYMAPEQLAGASVGPPADIYALGLVMLEALTGCRAFAGVGAEAVAARLARDPVIPPEMGEFWGSVLGEMTDRQPERRCTAVDLSRRLGTGPGALPTNVMPPPPLAPTTSFEAARLRPVSRTPPRRVLAVMAAVIAALVLIILLVTSRSSHGGAPPPPTTQPATTVAQPATTAAVSTTRPSSPPSTSTAARCASLRSQRQALDAQRQAIDQNKALTPQQRDAAHRNIDAQQRVLDQALKGC